MIADVVYAVEKQRFLKSCGLLNELGLRIYDMQLRSYISLKVADLELQIAENMVIADMWIISCRATIFTKFQMCDCI